MISSNNIIKNGIPEKKDRILNSGKINGTENKIPELKTNKYRRFSMKSTNPLSRFILKFYLYFQLYISKKCL